MPARAPRTQRKEQELKPSKGWGQRAGYSSARRCSSQAWRDNSQRTCHANVVQLPEISRDRATRCHQRATLLSVRTYVGQVLRPGFTMADVGRVLSDPPQMPGLKTRPTYGNESTSWCEVAQHDVKHVARELRVAGRHAGRRNEIPFDGRLVAVQAGNFGQPGAPARDETRALGDRNPIREIPVDDRSRGGLLRTERVDATTLERVGDDRLENAAERRYRKGKLAVHQRILAVAIGLLEIGSQRRVLDESETRSWRRGSLSRRLDCVGERFSCR